MDRIDRGQCLYLESSFPILWIPFGNADSLDDFVVDHEEDEDEFLVDSSDSDGDDNKLELVDPLKRKRCVWGGLDETDSKNFDRSQSTNILLSIVNEWNDKTADYETIITGH